METREKDFKLLNVFTGVFVAVLVLVPSTGSKFIAIGPFNFPGGTLIFPLAFILNDVFTEVYGYGPSRRVIWTGLGCQMLAAFIYWLVGIWPAAPFWHNQEAYTTILGTTPRITAASFTAYLCGSFMNNVVLSKMKYAQAGRRGFAQGWRFVVSSIVGELFDSVVFMTIAFAGVLVATDFIKTLVALWIGKVLYEVAALPLSIRFTNWVKRVEVCDTIDRPGETNYNPFAAFSKD